MLAATCIISMEVVPVERQTSVVGSSIAERAATRA
jgi:hypothetical protein